MKKFFQEFKEFATKGNVMNLAIGVIIGGAFQKIVTSAINDLIMPLIGIITGDGSFLDQFLILKLPENVTIDQVTSLDRAKELSVTTFNYGSFISAVIDFLIMAFIIFLMVKGINKLTYVAKEGIGKIAGEVPVEETPLHPDTKKCPFCLSEIPYAAIKCSHCTSEVPNETFEETEEYLE